MNPLASLLDSRTASAFADARATLLTGAMLTVAEPARPIVLADLARTEPLLVLTPTARDAEQLAQHLRAFADGVVLFPAWETLPHERLSPRPETVARRLAALAAARDGTAAIIVAPIMAAMRPLVPGSERIAPVAITRGEERDLDRLVEDLVLLDYRRSDLVERRGELAVRGGILDLFPPTSDHPVRVEFFGDQIDDLRTFAVASQRSLEKIDRVEAYPCRELLPTDEVRGRALAAFESAIGQERADLAKLGDGMTFEGVEALLDVLWPDPPVLIDLLPGRHVVLWDPERLTSRATEALREVEELRAAAWHAASDGRPAPAGGGLVDLDRAIGDRASGLSSFRGEHAALDVKVWEDGRGDVPKVAEAIKTLVRDGTRVIVTATTDGAAARIAEVLQAHDITAPFLEGAPEPGTVRIAVAPLEEGFIAPGSGLAIVGETDLFGKRRAHREPKTQRRFMTPLDLAEGDLVVHDVHGVGRFRGVVTREFDHGVADYIVLEYAEGDKLFVPADQLDAVSKYVGGEVGKLHRLGTSDWGRQKAKVRKAVKDMADELIVLYSARASDPGFAFSNDQPWQAELEDAFPYVETRDQLSAIDDVKSDMERPSPMDRLICGDVGFGKTEIAIRAAFKAVMDQKQVAVLVPTTLLAQQHYATFTERFAPFPVRVAMLSRWVSAGDQQRLVDELASGKVDVIIGTHRILQKDLRFADLGLLIIDEEQRFGVAHKERLKQLKHSVDVLTMTATPIPRTLEMAMGGIRDMSVIDTPPEDRHPVLTFVEPQADEVIARAIRREMLRDGQTFYVHNTVHDLDAVARRVMELVPDARIAIAHGQMDERRLESVMLDFWDRQFDVLVTTTIIESGLDIPTANTLIVENADRLGLAQLYQLRGRVGRSRERAYAYFLYPGDREMTETSHARLTAIGQLTDLGSGLQIALRDLEIRGAGNLLGGEQSGHIAAVGFDLYVRLLGEAIAEAKGKPQEQKPEVKIDLPLDAHLPEEWIPREGLRLDAYRRIASAMTEQDLTDVRAELHDRYGPLPAQAESLLDVARIRMLVGPRGARTVHGASDTIRIEPLPLEEWEQVRAKRIIHGAIFKAATFTLIIPQPRAPEGGVARWLFAALTELFRDDDED